DLPAAGHLVAVFERGGELVMREADGDRQIAAAYGSEKPEHANRQAEEGDQGESEPECVTFVRHRASKYGVRVRRTAGWVRIGAALSSRSKSFYQPSTIIFSYSLRPSASVSGPWVLPLRNW